MAKPKASKVAAIAASLTKRNPPIPYVFGGQTISGLDCQGYVEYCVNSAGGKMDYAGSNDMFRNAGTVYTLKEAKELGLLIPACGLLIVEHDGKEPERYKADKKGNASHVGFYLDMDGVEVGHASSSKKCVTKSTIRNGWTHVILFSGIDYSEYIDTQEGETMQTTLGTYKVNAGGGLRMRKSPNQNGAYMMIIPDGTTLDILEVQNNFGKAAYKNHAGWCSMDYLVPCEDTETISAVDSETNDDLVAIPRSVLIDLADAQNNLSAWADRQFFGVNAAIKDALVAMRETAAYLKGDD